MTLQEASDFFARETAHRYTRPEITELFRIFAEHIFGLQRLQWRHHPYKKLTPEEEAEFYSKTQQLKTGVPYQQIFGVADFFRMKFFVDSHVLIPRPETEELLELAIENINAHFTDTRALKFLDIGTGSGVIPIVLKKYFPQAEVVSLDVSARALHMAKKNAAYHQTEIRFLCTDYLQWTPDQKYHAIISNPPYIAQSEFAATEDAVKNFEPPMALFSPTEDALVFYRKIAKDAADFLDEKGWLFLEINQKLGVETLAIFNNFSEKALLKDISGNHRMIWVRK